MIFRRYIILVTWYPPLSLFASSLWLLSGRIAFFISANKIYVPSEIVTDHPKYHIHTIDHDKAV